MAPAGLVPIGEPNHEAAKRENEQRIQGWQISDSAQLLTRRESEKEPMQYFR